MWEGMLPEALGEPDPVLVSFVFVHAHVRDTSGST